MRDPVDQLRDLSVEAGDPPLPAAEVRRRGERLRRRRTAFQAAGATAAIAVIASGGLLVAGPTDRPAPDPLHAPGAPPRQSSTAPTPSQGPSPDPRPPEPAPPAGWPTEVRGDLGLTQGLPSPGGDNGQVRRSHDLAEPWAFDPCRDGLQPDEGRVDMLTVRLEAPAQFYQRQLAVYPDAAAAAEVMAGFDDAAERCARYAFDDGVSEDVLVRYRDLDAGDESLSVVAHAEQSGMRFTPAAHYSVVRVGNAVLVAAYDGEFGAGGRDQVLAVTREHLHHARAIAARMCVFSADPCPEE